MRVQKCKFCDIYKDRKNRVYSDNKCTISKYKGGLICVFYRHSTVVSKRQRDWMKLILNKLTEALGKFKITESKENKEEHFYLYASPKAKKKKKSKKTAVEKN